jgi:hypothetical protein
MYAHSVSFRSPILIARNHLYFTGIVVSASAEQMAMLSRMLLHTMQSPFAQSSFLKPLFARAQGQTWSEKVERDLVVEKYFTTSLQDAQE